MTKQKRITKQLRNRIRHLEEEIEAIHAFATYPVVDVSRRKEPDIRDQPGFTPVERYAHRYVLHFREIGFAQGIRYRSKTVWKQWKSLDDAVYRKAGNKR